MDGEQNGFDVSTMVGEDGSFTDQFHSSLPGVLGEGFENFDGFKKYKSLPDLLKGAAHASKKLGEKTEGMVKVPGENATPEEIAAYRKAMGVPDKPDAYEIKRPEGKEYDVEGEKAFKALAHEHGLTGPQLQAIFEFYDKYEEGIVTKMAEQQVKEHELAEKAFTEKYGTDAEKVKRLAGEAMKELGFDKVAEDFEKSEFKNNLNVVAWFYEMRQKMLPGQHHESGSPGGQAKKGDLTSVYTHKTSVEQLHPKK